MLDRRFLPHRPMGTALHLLLIVTLSAAVATPALAQDKEPIQVTAVPPPFLDSTTIGGIRGKVLGPNGASLSNATIHLTPASTNQQLATQSDAHGDYFFLSVPAGPAFLTIGCDHCIPAQRNINVQAGRPLDMGSIGLRKFVRYGAVLPPSAVPPPEPKAVKLAVAEPAQFKPETTQAVPPPVSFVAPSATDSNNLYGNPATDFVTVSSNAVAGPMGYVATPSLTSATQSSTAQQQAFEASQNFNYPSIIFYISAVPLVNPNAVDDPKDSPTSQEIDENPLWLDASFTLTFLDAKGNPLPNACTDGSIQVLGLLPQQTVSALKNRTAANIGTGITDAAGAIASFIPSEQTAASAATTALNAVFQNIFPPQPVAFEYSNMNGNCNFGWYFRPNTSAGAGGAASILGIQTGIVLLKTTRNIASIRVNGRSLSAWSKPPTKSSKRLFAVPDQLIGTIKLPDLADVDFDTLTAPLSMFPSLIPKSTAMLILHTNTDADFLTFAKANKLIGTNATFDYVTNASLSAFMISGAPTPTPPATPPTGTTPKPAPTPTSKPKPKSTPATKPS